LDAFDWCFELPQCANIKTDNLVDPDEDQSLNDTKFFNSFSYAWMQYGGNLCILWPLRLHWNCNFDHWKFSTMGLLFILLPTKNTICIYYYYSYTRNYLHMHKLNESFCFAKISPSSWNFVLGLWLVWNCSMHSFDFFSWCRIFFLQGSNAKLNFDGCPLLYWGCFLHNAISRIVLAWEIQSYLSITSNLPCTRRQRCISTGVCHNSSSRQSFNRGRYMPS